MSLGNPRIPEQKAQIEAEVALREEIGNLPHLGEPEREDGEYIFPILISLPKVIFDENGEEPIEVRFLDEERVGSIQIDASSGEVKDFTSLSSITDGIEQKEREIRRAVQRALVKSEAKAFSLLPYSAHRITPIQDALSEIILSGSISDSTLEEMGDEAYKKYSKHLETIIDVDLIRREGDLYVAGNKLTEIISEHDKTSEMLNKSLEFLFKEKAQDLDMLTDIVGPQLKIAGYYYRRALEADQLPKVSKEEITARYVEPYSGQQERQKRFKVARYLLQLEQIGLLRTDTLHNERVWRGKQSIKSGIMEQRDELGSLAEIAPA